MNKNNRPLGWTTVEEAQQLVKTGLPVETADMHYLNYSDNEFNALTFPYVDTSPSIRTWVIPCWSLGALLELIPAEITYSDFKPFKLGIFKDDNKDECHYFIQYYPLYEGGVFCEACGHTLVKASINMILYLLNNKFIKYEQ